MGISVVSSHRREEQQQRQRKRSVTAFVGNGSVAPTFVPPMPGTTPAGGHGKVLRVARAPRAGSQALKPPTLPHQQQQQKQQQQEGEEAEQQQTSASARAPPRMIWDDGGSPQREGDGTAAGPAEPEQVRVATRSRTAV